MKYNLPKDAKELRSQCDKAIKSAQTIRNNVQQAAISVLHHAYKCGDYTEANYLVEGLGHGVKRDSLVEFFVKCGGLVVNEQGDAFGGWKGKEFIKANFGEAKEQMWWDFKKANPFKGFNLDDEIQKLLKRKSKIEKDSEGMEAADQELISLNVNDATIQMLLKACNFEAIIDGDDATNDDIAEYSDAPSGVELDDKLMAEIA